MHALPWLWRVCIEHLQRCNSYNKPNGLKLALIQDLGAPIVQFSLPYDMVYIGVVFYPHVFWLLVPHDAWKIMYYDLLWFLEGKQFERGGFVTSFFCFWLGLKGHHYNISLSMSSSLGIKHLHMVRIIDIMGHVDPIMSPLWDVTLLMLVRVIYQ